jgi:N-acetylneuraminate lyase
MRCRPPDLPFYYYHIPHLTGVNMDMREVLEAGQEKIRRFAGVKYTASTVWEYQLAKAHGNNKFDLLFGMDEMMLPALSVGATGFIRSTYNFAAPLYQEVVGHFENGQLREAREKMLYPVQMVSIILKFPPIARRRS